jgi:hypothetical protein
MCAELIGGRQDPDVAMPVDDAWRNAPSDHWRFSTQMDRNRMLKSQISGIVADTIVELVSRNECPVGHSVRQAENERFLHFRLSARRESIS